MPGLSDKTLSRDIALLKRSGAPIRFSGQRKAFILADKDGNALFRKKHRAKPDFPEGKKEQQYLEKIIRLTTMMDHLPDEDCDVWYTETFPNCSKRTMQRDFAVLKKVGYVVYYKRGWESPYGEGYDQLIRRYYFEGVYNP